MRGLYQTNIICKGFRPFALPTVPRTPPRINFFPTPPSSFFLAISPQDEPLRRTALPREDRIVGQNQAVKGRRSWQERTHRYVNISDPEANVPTILSLRRVPRDCITRLRPRPTNFTIAVINDQCYN